MPTRLRKAPFSCGVLCSRNIYLKRNVVYVWMHLRDEKNTSFCEGLIMYCNLFYDR